MFYSLFDGLIDKRDAYKVETIGDAYMVVSGAPHPTQKHASEIALLSLDLVDGIQHFVIPHRPDEKLRMRIGLHSGKLCIVVLLQCYRRGLAIV